VVRILGNRPLRLFLRSRFAAGREVVDGHRDDRLPRFGAACGDRRTVAAGYRGVFHRRADLLCRASLPRLASTKVSLGHTRGRTGAGALGWHGNFTRVCGFPARARAGAALLAVFFPATIVSLVVLETRWRPNLHGLRWIGDISYSTYLIHFPLQILFVLVFSMLGFTAVVFLSPWVLLLFFAILIPLALASFAWFERPVQNAIRRKFSPRDNKRSHRKASRLTDGIDTEANRTGS
jgi:peptidoglycan/LPS O-acetylase OafA/YrhL